MVLTMLLLIFYCCRIDLRLANHGWMLEFINGTVFLIISLVKRVLWTLVRLMGCIDHRMILVGIIDRYFCLVWLSTIQLRIELRIFKLRDEYLTIRTSTLALNGIILTSIDLRYSVKIMKYYWWQLFHSQTEYSQLRTFTLE